MKKWLHSLGTVGLLVATAASPVLQGVISSHPLVSAILFGAYTVIGHLLPSPLAK
jgi:hypothetical protein